MIIPEVSANGQGILLAEHGCVLFALGSFLLEEFGKSWLLIG